MQNVPISDLTENQIFEGPLFTVIRDRAGYGVLGRVSELRSVLTADADRRRNRAGESLHSL